MPHLPKLLLTYPCGMLLLWLLANPSRWDIFRRRRGADTRSSGGSKLSGT